MHLLSLTYKTNTFFFYLEIIQNTKQHESCTCNLYFQQIRRFTRTCTLRSGCEARPTRAEPRGSKPRTGPARVPLRGGHRRQEGSREAPLQGEGPTQTYEQQVPALQPRECWWEPSWAQDVRGLGSRGKNFAGCVAGSSHTWWHQVLSTSALALQKYRFLTVI